MTYALGGQTLKEFANRRFVRRLSGLEVHGDADLLARQPAERRGLKPGRFLMDLLGALPFPLLSVQVDGGSEVHAP